MMDLHQTHYKIHEILIVTDARKSHLGESLTDCRLKGFCYRLSI